jgi:hypothetical protein
MQMIYDSDAYVVVYINAAQADEVNRHNKGKPKRDGFEIVDKRNNMEVYLDGPWAAAFQAQVERWQEDTPAQEEVESVLFSYCELAQYPLIVH